MSAAPETGRRGEAGFTLIELLVALAIFAVISLMAFQGISALLHAERVVATQQTRLGDIERAVSLLARDLENLAPRPVRMAAGGLSPALSVNNDLHEYSLTRSGWTNPAEETRSAFERVRWQLDGTTLSRAYWLTLDSTGADQPVSAPLLENVSAFSMRVRWKSSWVDAWPSAEPGAEGIPRVQDQVAARLPEAVEFTLQIDNFGTVRRLIVLSPDVKPVASP